MLRTVTVSLALLLGVPIAAAEDRDPCRYVSVDDFFSALVTMGGPAPLSGDYLVFGDVKIDLRTVDQACIASEEGSKSFVGSLSSNGLTSTESATIVVRDLPTADELGDLIRRHPPMGTISFPGGPTGDVRRYLLTERHLTELTFRR